MRLILCCLLALAACGGDAGDDALATPDARPASDAAASSDAPNQNGLSVTWSAQPALPGPLANGVTVTSLKLKLARLEVIGDTGSTTGTTTTNVDLTWSQVQQPFPIDFFFAQPGLYSKVTLQIDGNVVAPSYEILGTVVINGTTEPFKISDTAALAVDINGYNVMLMAGRSAEVPIRVDMDDAVDAVDFGMLPTVGGFRTMNQSTMGIAAFRAALQTTTFFPD